MRLQPLAHAVEVTAVSALSSDYDINSSLNDDLEDSYHQEVRSLDSSYRVPFGR